MGNWRRARAVKPESEDYPEPKTTMQYKKPIGPEQPKKETKRERIGKAIKKAGDYAAPKIKSGVMRFAENASRSSGKDSSGGFHLSPPPDMFSFQAPSFMMGPMGPQEPAAPRPRRRKAKKKQAPARRQARGQGWQEIGGVPPEVKRWMM